jgi:hypothetical protein
MVRLQTNRWYGREGQSRARGRATPSPNNSRRLISLCILLALVLVLMQKASNPSYVRNAFSALGVPLDPQAATETAVPLDAFADDEASTSPLQRTYRELLPKLLQDATGTQLRTLAKTWFRPAAASPQPQTLEQPQTPEQQTLEPATTAGEQSPAAGEPGEATETGETTETASLSTLGASVAKQHRAMADSLAGSLSASDSKWSEPFNKFTEDVTRWSANLDDASHSDLRAGLSPEFVDTLTTYLDSYLIGTLRDASPWETSESLAFWRLLQRTGQASDERAGGTDSEPPLISTLQLESQRTFYRGHNIRFRGSVRRAEWITKSYPDLAMHAGYGILWLRGADRSQQPVAIYTTDELAKTLAEKQVDTPEGSSFQAIEFPEVELTGIVAKRLAYGATSGVQVAPTVFASKLTWLNATPITPDLQADAPNNFEVGRMVVVALLIAGAGLTVMLLTKPKQRPTRSKAKPNQGSLLLLLCGALVLSQAQPACAVQSGPAESAESSSTLPPWARDDASRKLAELMVKRLGEVLDPNGINRITAYISGEDPSKFPDAALKAMHALDQFGWTRALELGKQIEFDTAICSLRVVNKSGLVRLAMPVPLTEAQQAWFPYETLYRLEVDLDPPTTPLTADNNNAENNSPEINSVPQLVHVFCRSVPSAWLTSKQLRQPVTIKGLAINPAVLPGSPEDSPQTPFCILVDTPQWTIPPAFEIANLQPELKPQWLRLGQAGWNLSAIDLIAAQDQRGLSSGEQEAFYSFLRIAATLPWSEKEATTDTLQILGKPRENLGQSVSWLVRIVQASAVQLTDPRAVQTLGADRYYQYDGFVDIGQQKIRYKVALDNQSRMDPSAIPATETIEFQGEFPVTIVSAHPHLLTTEQLNNGRLSWEIGHYAKVHGEFFRLWSYHSEMLESKGSSSRQVAPLVAANSLALAASPESVAANPVGWFSAAIAFVVLGILGIIGFYVAFPLIRRRSKA